MAECITGTMIWVNLNLERDTKWSEYVRNTSSAGVVLQTYVIHNKYDYRRPESPYWWKHQSNVHGVVIAANDVPKSSIHEYPRTLETVIEYFIPGLIVTERNFETAKHIDIMQFLGKDKRLFFQALKTGFRCLLQHFRSSKQRTEARWSGRSYGLVATALDQCNEIAEVSEEDEADAGISNQTMQTIAYDRCNQTMQTLQTIQSNDADSEDDSRILRTTRAIKRCRREQSNDVDDWN